MSLSASATELAAKSFALVRSLAAELSEHDPLLALVARAMWKVEIEQTEKTVMFQGFPVVIENPAGSTREWTDPASGEKGSTVMRYAYGYIEGTRGADGDEYDVFLGPDPTSQVVFVVDQVRITDGQPDEQKALIGFTTANDALQAYMVHYDDPNFLGSINAIPLEEFRQKVYGTKTDPGSDGMVKSMAPAAPAVQYLIFPEEMSKGVSASLLPAASRETDNGAVAGGTAGLNVAIDAPPQPMNLHDPSFMLSVLNAAADSKVEPYVHPKSEFEYNQPAPVTHSADEYVQSLPDYAEPKPETNLQVLQTQAAFRADSSQAASEVLLEKTVTKSELGECTLRILKSGRFDVRTPKHDFLSFESLSAACDHVWVLQKGFGSVDEWRQSSGTRKVPSGKGWKFWGLRGAPEAT